MPDTQRTTSALQALFADNTAGDISAQDLRDFTVSSYNRLDDLLLTYVNQFRLSTETGVPVSTSDQSAKSTIYMTPYTGNQIALYDGSSKWLVYATSEISIALSSLTSAKNYDVFAYYTGSAVALELSSAWTSNTARNDALTRQDGVLVKSGATTRRYLGTFRTTGTTTTEDSLTKRFLWNVANQVHKPMIVLESTNTWNYTTDTIRQANASSSNQVEYVTGDAASLIQARALAAVYLAGNSARAAKAGVGIDSTTTFSGIVQAGYVLSASGSYVPVTGSYIGYPGLGYHYLSWNEKGPDGTAVWVGDNGGDGQQTGLLAYING